MQESTRSWLTWPIFYTLSEIYQVPLNIIWFILSGAIAYHEFHTVNLINIFLCCLDVMIFDLAMNYTPTKVGGFWEYEVVFRVLHVYSQYLTYGTSLFYHG